MIDVKEARRLMYNYKVNYDKELALVEEAIVCAANNGKSDVTIPVPSALFDKFKELLIEKGFTVDVTGSITALFVKWEELPF